MLGIDSCGIPHICGLVVNATEFNRGSYEFDYRGEQNIHMLISLLLKDQ